MNFSQGAIDLIKQFEGFRSNPYLDSVGVPTIGYGTTFYEDGTKVTMSDSSIDETRAESILLNYLNTIILPNFQNKITNTNLNQNNIDALCSFVYNIGNNGFNNSHVLSIVNSNDFTDLEKWWLAWDKAGGQVNQGLLNRRNAEYKYFIS